MSTCSTCKHWEPEGWVREGLDDPDIPNADHHEGECQVLHDTLTIEENVSTGYGSEGPHGIGTVETPWDFGCNKWVAGGDKPTRKRGSGVAAKQGQLGRLRREP